MNYVLDSSTLIKGLVSASFTPIQNKRQSLKLYHTGMHISDVGLYTGHSFQNLLSSRLLSKNLKIRIYRIIILPVVLYGCETWSLTLREEHRLGVFENRVLRTIFRPKKNVVIGE
jgi:hypothetical protein